MIKILKITGSTSITNDVYPYLEGQLKSQGYSLIRVSQTDINESRLERDLLVVMALTGKHFSKSFAHHLLEGRGDSEPLSTHTEGIYAKSGVVPYFALGCIRPSVDGGETRIYDARRAAVLLSKKDRSLCAVRFLYTSAAYADEKAEHALVEKYNSWDVLRYRSKGPYNKLLSDVPSEEHLHKTVEGVLKQSVVLKHVWAAGDILFVHNNITLHDRLPYSGIRKMLRVRFDDSKNHSIHY